MKQLWNNIKGEVIKYTAALVAVLFIGAVIIWLQGGNPAAAVRAIFTGSLVGTGSIARTIRWVTPSILAGIAATVAFKSSVNNLGIDGQIYVGAFVAAMVGYAVSLPGYLHGPLTMLAAGLAAMLFAFIPAILKMRFHVNEMITTLMFNYVALLLTEYLALRFVGFDAAHSPEQVATPPILASAKLSLLFPPYQATTGIFIALFAAVAAYLIYAYTVKGYELKQVGENARFAEQGGVKVASTYLLIFLLSGFIAGLTGAVEIMGPHGRFRPQFATNLGWDGIMIALIAKNNPLGVVLVGAIWGIIKNGAFAMERMTDTSRLVITLIQALFVLFVTVNFQSLFDNIRQKWAQRRTVAEQRGGVAK